MRVGTLIHAHKDHPPLPLSVSSLSGALITHSGWRWFFSGSEGRQHQALGGGTSSHHPSRVPPPSPPAPRGVGGPTLRSQSRTPITILHPFPHSCLSVSLTSPTPSSSWVSSPFVVYYSSCRLSSRPTLVLSPLLAILAWQNGLGAAVALRTHNNTVSLQAVSSHTCSREMKPATAAVSRCVLHKATVALCY